MKSPGARWDAVLVAGGAGAGIPVGSEGELGYRLLPRGSSSESPAPKGRRPRPATGGDAAAAGPMRRWPERASAVLASRPACRGIVARLRADVASSSRTSTRLACESRALINLDPDHLDRHECSRRGAAKLRFSSGRAEGVRLLAERRFNVPADSSSGADDPLSGRAAHLGEHNRGERRRRRTPSRARSGSPTRRSPLALVSFPGVEHRLEHGGPRSRAFAT